MIKSPLFISFDRDRISGEGYKADRKPLSVPFYERGKRVKVNERLILPYSLLTKEGYR
jgi:hypothetical protein